MDAVSVIDALRGAGRTTGADEVVISPQLRQSFGISSQLFVTCVQ